MLVEKIRKIIQKKSSMKMKENINDNDSNFSYFLPDKWGKTKKIDKNITMAFSKKEIPIK